ncbi:hypothetical protein [Ruminococcus flavefaciens]|uniref:hypothetical protein n=1 Tax=Ruminococcus flavefaciens TaxID=1265 RepID=UPI0026F20663|nr:hypothetical protein [Ruminococcus flavefaciens]
MENLEKDTGTEFEFVLGASIACVVTLFIFHKNLSQAAQFVGGFPSPLSIIK